MRGLCLALLLFALSAGPARAGAWPRGAGAQFMAVTSRVTLTPTGRIETSNALYFDRGLTERAGLMIELDADGTGGLTKALLLAQLSLLPPNGPWALSAAVGGGRLGAEAAATGRLMLGRGLRVAGRPGWAELSLGVERNLATGRGALKLDATAGLAVTKGIKAYTQLFAYRARGGPMHLRLGTSTAVRIGPATWLDIGLSAALTPHRDRQLKLGVWMEF